MRIFLLLLAPALLSGCLTIGGPRIIETDPSGALVSVEGYGECETPCTIELDEPRRIRVSKAGYVSKVFVIQPGSGVIEIPMDLAAASQDVDAEALPDL